MINGLHIIIFSNHLDLQPLRKFIMIIIIYLHMKNFQVSEIIDSNFVNIQNKEKFNFFGLELKKNLLHSKKSLYLMKLKK